MTDYRWISIFKKKLFSFPLIRNVTRRRRNTPRHVVLPEGSSKLCASSWESRVCKSSVNL